MYERASRLCSVGNTLIRGAEVYAERITVECKGAGNSEGNGALLDGVARGGAGRVGGAASFCG
jgi:hypothetical protein